MRRQISLTDQDGRHIGVFSFDPADKGLPSRIARLSKAVPGIVRPLNQVSINPDGTCAGDESQVIYEAEQRLFKAVDRAFGSGAAAGIFQTVRPFAIVQRRFWCENLAQLCNVALSCANEERKR